MLFLCLCVCRRLVPVFVVVCGGGVCRVGGWGGSFLGGDGRRRKWLSWRAHRYAADTSIQKLKNKINPLFLSPSSLFELP